MTEAIQSDRNSGSPNGAQGETECFAESGATIGMLIISAIRILRRNPTAFSWLVWRLEHNQTDTAQPPTAEYFLPIWRPPRIYELPNGIRELPDPIAVPVHHEDLKSVLSVSREHNPRAIRRPRRPSVQIRCSREIVIT